MLTYNRYELSWCQSSLHLNSSKAGLLRLEMLSEQNETAEF